MEEGCLPHLLVGSFDGPIACVFGQVESDGVSAYPLYFLEDGVYSYTLQMLMRVRKMVQEGLGVSQNGVSCSVNVYKYHPPISLQNSA